MRGSAAVWPADSGSVRSALALRHLEKAPVRGGIRFRQINLAGRRDARNTPRMWTNAIRSAHAHSSRDPDIRSVAHRSDAWSFSARILRARKRWLFTSLKG